jgi:hypothetical protein
MLPKGAHQTAQKWCLRLYAGCKRVSCAMGCLQECCVLLYINIH